MRYAFGARKLARVARLMDEGKTLPEIVEALHPGTSAMDQLIRQVAARLRKAGLIEELGRERRKPMGAPPKVWKLTSRGQEWLRNKGE